MTEAEQILDAKLESYSKFINKTGLPTFLVLLACAGGGVFLYNVVPAITKYIEKSNDVQMGLASSQEVLVKAVIETNRAVLETNHDIQKMLKVELDSADFMPQVHEEHMQQEEKIDRVEESLKQVDKVLCDAAIDIRDIKRSVGGGQ